MKVIHADHIGDAFRKGVNYLLAHGERDDSRNGAVIRAPYPVTTIYKNPRRRVLVNPVRRANPFFHLVESMWMLAGRNDVAFVARYNKRMKEFSDDGVTFWGAYGHRWRTFFGYDQLMYVVDELRRNPRSRRCVVSMWSGGGMQPDLVRARQGGKDVPCNTHIYFLRRPHSNVLDMTVCNRSNDAIWGCYGANAVHFSILHEFVATLSGMEMGRYYQVSNDLHVYTDVYNEEKLAEMANTQNVFYPTNVLPLFQPLDELSAWTDDLFRFMDGEIITDFRTRWFNELVKPMAWAWRCYKRGDLDEAKATVSDIPPDDWRVAAASWLNGVKQ